MYIVLDDLRDFCLTCVSDKCAVHNDTFKTAFYSNQNIKVNYCLFSFVFLFSPVCKKNIWSTQKFMPAKFFKNANSRKFMPVNVSAPKVIFNNKLFLFILTPISF